MQGITRPRVLCVDDDEDSREMLIALLRLELIEAKTVGTAVQALATIQTEHFDLYLLDSRLPDLDGFDLCRRMRDIDPDTPILFFSGAAFEADKERGIEAGANAYVIKPDLDGLLGSIKQFVSRAESAPAKIIPFGRKASLSPSFTLEPSALDIWADMNTGPSKEEERQEPEPQAEIEFPVDPNRWSTPYGRGFVSF